MNTCIHFDAIRLQLPVALAGERGAFTYFAVDYKTKTRTRVRQKSMPAPVLRDRWPEKLREARREYSLRDASQAHRRHGLQREFQIYLRQLGLAQSWDNVQLQRLENFLTTFVDEGHKELGVFVSDP